MSTPAADIVDVAPILKRFCSEDDRRPILQIPWQLDIGYAASNGRDLIFIPIQKGITATGCTTEGFPNISQFPVMAGDWEGPQLELPQEWETNSPKVIECSRCKGSGSFTCRHCDQTEHECRKCDGMGNRENPEPVPLRHADGSGFSGISPRFLRLYQELAGTGLRVAQATMPHNIVFVGPHQSTCMTSIRTFYDEDGLPLDDRERKAVIKRFWPNQTPT